jgi:hypothetical protein
MPRQARSKSVFWLTGCPAWLRRVRGTSSVLIAAKYKTLAWDHPLVAKAMLQHVFLVVLDHLVSCFELEFFSKRHGLYFIISRKDH